MSVATDGELELPARYEPIRRLGRGGGGEVWAVRDRGSGQSYALKALAAGATEREVAALVREAAALSGLEGLGVPRVVRFGRLPRSSRPYLVREIVEGESLEQFLARGGDVRMAVEAVARAAEQLTVLHRAGVLHGDVKPGNLILDANGAVTFVDLGLAAPWREGGAVAEGLTPRYAAPELFSGKPITVRAEVYALGVMLAELLEEDRSSWSSSIAAELAAVARHATADNPEDRYPSADELANAIRRAVGTASPLSSDAGALLWPIGGIEATASLLLDAAQALAPGEALRLVGPPGSGRSALTRRLAWWLGAFGRPVAWIEDSSSRAEVQVELAAQAGQEGAWIVIDDADALDDDSVRDVTTARASGARLVLVGGARFPEAREFAVPPLDDHTATELVRRAVPSLTAGLQKRVVSAAAGRPGLLRSLLRSLSSEAVASQADVDRVLGGSGADVSLPEEPLDRIRYFLDRGRFNDARAALDTLPEERRGGVDFDVAQSRLELGLGDPGTALARLERRKADPSLSSEDARGVAVIAARAAIGVGQCQRALDELAPFLEAPDSLGVEALCYHGLGASLSGRHAEEREELERAVQAARERGLLRLEALSLASLGLALQRADQNDAAREQYRAALLAAERVGDAGTLATVQLNLAGLLKIRGDIAGAIELFGAAVDMGKRSGRRGTARQALLNLANTDLYLGRLSRAESAIATLRQQSAELPEVMRAQLRGLEAELLSRQGRAAEAAEAYEECAAAYEALGRGSDAAEARLEGVLAAVRQGGSGGRALAASVAAAEALLGETPVHRPLLLLAKARVAALIGDEADAREELDRALAAARAASQREWLWRALEARAELEEAGGQPLLARRDREEALAVLEEIGARLPRDLREVYWNDPRRKQLRSIAAGAIGSAATELLPFLPFALSSPAPARDPASRLTSTSSSLSQIGGLTPLEQRLAKILEINAELAGELDVPRLTARITHYAVDLLRAERGLVLLVEADGRLEVHATSAARSDDHAEFSKSIAETVVATREPVVTLDAPTDVRLQSFASVHQLMLKSVACVPILASSGEALGALYLETRLRAGRHFERELPTLRAFADQVAIALQNARLHRENRERAEELARANEELATAQQRLRELLEGRTEQLRRTRQKLRDARETLYGHFGYQGLVGTSAAMRRVYALVERVRATEIPVLITGESGTGKEVVARAIHDASGRSKSRMLAVNCGAIPENLLESELFGHVRGAFTGADRERKGLFREADGGTLLLDEIGEMPVKMQAGLLRVLQEGRVRPVGGATEDPVNVRLIFATNRDLSQLVKQGGFREDLYYRIHVVEIHLPSLRERREDVPQLVDHFLGIFAARYKRDKKTVSREALRRLQNYEWPGNVRQLEHVLLNAWVMADAEELEAEDFEIPDQYRPAVDERAGAGAAATARAAVKRGTTSQHRRDERERILDALRACNWNRVRAAEMSGIPRRTFYRRLREYGIQ